MRYLVMYLCTLVVFLAIDAVWLGIVARDFYRNQFGSLLLDQPIWGVALAFYAIYVVGLVLFVVAPGYAQGSGLLSTFAWGAAFGFFAYATYDLTNHATLRNWPPLITVVDLAWGTLLSGTSAMGGLFLARRFLGG